MDLMICSICKKPVPFGMEIHMLAAHGAKRAQYALETERIKQDQTAKSERRSYGGRKRRATGSKGQLQHPRRSRLS